MKWGWSPCWMIWTYGLVACRNCCEDDWKWWWWWVEQSSRGYLILVCDACSSSGGLITPSSSSSYEVSCWNQNRGGFNFAKTFLRRQLQNLTTGGVLVNLCAEVCKNKLTLLNSKTRHQGMSLFWNLCMFMNILPYLSTFMMIKFMHHHLSTAEKMNWF